MLQWNFCVHALLLGWLILGASETPGSRLLAVEQVQTLPARAMVRFTANSTLHGFGGELPAQPFTLLISNGTWSAAADVLTGQMATRNTDRDRNMHQMLGTNAHPRIHGEVVAAPIPGPAGTNVTLTLKIRGQAQTLRVRILNWTESSEEIRFRAAWELSLKQYGLKPPSVIGIIRVSDTVKLEADVVAPKSVPPSPDKATFP